MFECGLLPKPPRKQQNIDFIAREVTRNKPKQLFLTALGKNLNKTNHKHLQITLTVI